MLVFQGGYIMRTLLVLIALAALALPAGADECVPTASDALTLEAPDATYYLVVDNEMCQPGCLFSTWILQYEETNGIEGLQRADLRHDDTCGGMIEADEATVLF